jgi:glutathionyl-hydroquinone reductase
MPMFPTTPSSVRAGPDTEIDIRLAIPLVRWDAAYHFLFKGDLRRIAEYRNLTAYLERMLVIPGVAGTINIDDIKRGYYSVKSLDPTGLVPLGPELGPGCLLAAPAKEAA